MHAVDCVLTHRVSLGFMWQEETGLHVAGRAPHVAPSPEWIECEVDNAPAREAFSKLMLYCRLVGGARATFGRRACSESTERKLLAFIVSKASRARVSSYGSTRADGARVRPAVGGGCVSRRYWWSEACHSGGSEDGVGERVGLGERGVGARARQVMWPGAGIAAQATASRASDAASERVSVVPATARSNNG